jgi:hypothetical protein
MNHYRRWGWYHTQHRVFGMGLIKTFKTGGMLLWHMLDHFQQALSAAIVAHAFTQPNSKHIFADPASVQLDDQDCVAVVFQHAEQSALAHTLYKMKVRRARLLGLTLGI